MKSEHLYFLEQEAISIFRDTVATAERPVMLYSIGKDSSVLLHLARKAFFPGAIPFPLLHIDTTFKFREMIAFRDRVAKEIGFELRVHTNQAGVKQKLNPFEHGSYYTDVMKTAALKEALDEGEYDIAIGGARRDEDASRSKERIVSFRAPGHGWDPKGQRPELWSLFNTQIHKGESLRVFPLSNWTEADIWAYIEQEEIEIVPLYFAKKRPVVERDGMLIMIDDDRIPLKPGEKPMEMSVRFRTLGCYPLTGAVESSATTLPEIISETLAATTSERSGRAIDKDSIASMKRKKRDGYF